MFHMFPHPKTQIARQKSSVKDIGLARRTIAAKKELKLSKRRVIATANIAADAARTVEALAARKTRISAAIDLKASATVGRADRQQKLIDALEAERGSSASAPDDRIRESVQL